MTDGWKDTLSVKTFLIVVVVVIIIAFLLRDKKIVTDKNQQDPNNNDPVATEINRRVRHTVRSAGYVDDFKIHTHASHSFTRNKRDVHVCSSCVMDNDDDLDRATYVGLHEAARSKSSSLFITHDEQT